MLWIVLYTFGKYTCCLVKEVLMQFALTVWNIDLPGRMNAPTINIQFSRPHKQNFGIYCAVSTLKIAILQGQ